MSRSPAKAVCPCFNTQPPEGGWRRIGWLSMCQRQSFNTQPPEGGWSPPAPPLLFWLLFQHTAARRRLGRRSFRFRYLQSFNTQPPEGGWLLQRLRRFGQPMFQHTAARRRLGHMAAVGFARLCFNTQPPEGGWRWFRIAEVEYIGVSTHSRPKAAGIAVATEYTSLLRFQHTAARRRLDGLQHG